MYTGIVLEIKRKEYVIGFQNPINNRYFNLSVPKTLVPDGTRQPKLYEIVNINISSRSTETNIIPLSISGTNKVFTPFNNLIKEERTLHVFRETLLMRTLFALDVEGYDTEDFLSIVSKISGNKYLIDVKLPLPPNILHMRYAENKK